MLTGCFGMLYKDWIILEETHIYLFIIVDEKKIIFIENLSTIFK